MKKKEFAVGEVFHFGFKKLKVVKGHKGNNCRKCYLYRLGMFGCNRVVGSCSAHNRRDKTDVIFMTSKGE